LATNGEQICSLNLSWLREITENKSMKLFVAGLSYKTAPVELREKLAVHVSQLRCCGCRLKVIGDLSEVVLVSTCNRVEIYGVTPKVNGNVHSIFQHLSGSTDTDLSPHLYVKEGSEAVRHLYSVASGLDSMVLGETEITGQVKLAYQAAQQAKLTGRVLNRVFQTALQTAKEIRTQTTIGRGATSVGSVAVELAERIFKTLADKTVMIVGAGKMGEACVRHLSKKGARSVLVSNRSFDRARALAEQIGGHAIPLEDCLTAMVDADIVVSSTGCPGTVLHREQVAQVMTARGNRPLVLIDIAVPRDIAADVQTLNNVYLYNVDDLEVIVRENVRSRKQELSRCTTIIGERTEAVMAKISPVPPKVYETDIRHQPAWLFRSAVACGN
jgi:glutamyl-tRNA reductase